MLGLINFKKGDKVDYITVVPGKNCYAVNLQPWDVVKMVNPSKRYPDGKRVIPAATQEDFKTILKSCPEESAQIGELTPEQEKVVRASLAAHCGWYKKENNIETKKDFAASTPKQ